MDTYVFRYFSLFTLCRYIDPWDTVLLRYLPISQSVWTYRSHYGKDQFKTKQAMYE